MDFWIFLRSPALMSTRFALGGSCRSTNSSAVVGMRHTFSEISAPDTVVRPAAMQ